MDLKKEKLRSDVSQTFATAEGRRTLRWLMEQCGYQALSAKTNDDIQYNAGRRDLYLTIRNAVSTETLIAVENKGLEQDDSD